MLYGTEWATTSIIGTGHSLELAWEPSSPDPATIRKQPAGGCARAILLGCATIEHMESKTWLVKQEPESYSWSDLVSDGQTAWTGVRNFQARNNLRAMRVGDMVFFYHSGEEKRIVGIATVTRESYPDSTAEEGDWSCVDLAPVGPLAKSIELAFIKSDDVLSSMPLVRNSRLSVVPLTEQHKNRVLELGCSSKAEVQRMIKDCARRASRH